MDERMNPEELRELLGAFALGAIDDDEERARVQEFVLEDPDARAELHELEQAVGWLGHASPQPTAESWDAVRRAMDQDLADDAARAVAADTASESGSVTPLAAHRVGRSARYWKPLVAVAAAVALLVAIGGVALLAGEGSGSRPPQTVALSRVALRAPDGSRAAVMTIRSDGTGTIRSTAMAPAPEGRVYQLWARTLQDPAFQSAGVLGASVGSQRVRVPRDATLVAISIEPAGGSVRPTTDPVAVSRTF